jgi:hypothetical protein
MKGTMKLAAIVLCSLTGICVLAESRSAASSSQADSQDMIHEGRKWTHLAGLEIPESMVKRPEKAGAPGASVAGFLAGNRAGSRRRGCMIVTVIDRPAVAAFVGWDAPSDHPEARRDLRAAFKTSDGKVHVVKFGGGCGNGLLFHSPDGLDIASVKHVALYYDSEAKWAQ